MSENLRKLRIEATATTKELAEARKRGIDVRKLHQGITPEEYGKLYSVGGRRVRITDIDSLEHQAQAKREEEQRIKDELKHAEEEQKRTEQRVKEEQKKIIENLIVTLESREEEERKDMNNYNALSQRFAKTFPTVSKLFDSIANDEQKHWTQLGVLIRELRNRIR